MRRGGRLPFVDVGVENRRSSRGRERGINGRGLKKQTKISVLVGVKSGNYKQVFKRGPSCFVV